MSFAVVLSVVTASVVSLSLAAGLARYTPSVVGVRGSPTDATSPNPPSVDDGRPVQRASVGPWTLARAPSREAAERLGFAEAVAPFDDEAVAPPVGVSAMHDAGGHHGAVACMEACSADGDARCSSITFSRGVCTRRGNAPTGDGGDASPGVVVGIRVVDSRDGPARDGTRDVFAERVVDGRAWVSGGTLRRGPLLRGWMRAPSPLGRGARVDAYSAPTSGWRWTGGACADECTRRGRAGCAAYALEADPAGFPAACWLRPGDGGGAEVSRTFVRR